MGRVAVDGDTVLFADAFDENADLLDEAIARHEAGEGFDPAAFARALGDEADDDALIKLYASPDLIRSLASDADLPWLNALRSVGASLRLDSDAIVADLHARTDPDDLSAEDLPLEAGDDAPEAPDADGALNGANRNQSRTTVFLAQLARKAYPDSTFVREVEALEADLGISFEEEVLSSSTGRARASPTRTASSAPSARSPTPTACASCSRGSPRACRRSSRGSRDSATRR